MSIINADKIVVNDLTVETINGVSIDCFKIENNCKQYCNECQPLFDSELTQNLDTAVQTNFVTLVPQEESPISVGMDGIWLTADGELKFNDYTIALKNDTNTTYLSINEGTNSSYDSSNDENDKNIAIPELYKQSHFCSNLNNNDTVVSSIGLEDCSLHAPNFINNDTTEFIFSNNDNIVTLDTGSGLFNIVGLNIETNNLSHLKFGMDSSSNDELYLNMCDINANNIELKIDPNTNDASLSINDNIGDEVHISCHSGNGSILKIADRSQNQLIYLADGTNNSQFSITNANMDVFQVNLYNDGNAETTETPSVVIARGSISEDVHRGNLTKITSETFELFGNTNGETNNEPSILLNNGTDVFDEPIILVKNVDTNDSTILSPNSISVNSDSYGFISLSNDNEEMSITVTDNTNNLVIYPQYIQLPTLDKFPKNVSVGAICCKSMRDNVEQTHLWWFNGKNWIMFA